LKIEELFKTVWSLLKPGLDILTSFRYTATGWYDYVKSFLQENFDTHSWKFYLGLFGLVVLLISGGGYMLMKYVGRRQIAGETTSV